jgi:hypothetical protein
MKKLTFSVTVEFAEKITSDNDVLQVAKNIAAAIVDETNGMGIAPQDSDNYTKLVSVTPQFINETVTESCI